MKAPKIFVIIKRAEYFHASQAVAWSFDEREAGDEARRLNAGEEWGPHVVEEVDPIGEPVEVDWRR